MVHIKRSSLQKFLFFYIPAHILIYYAVLFLAPNHFGKYMVTGILSLMGPCISSIILFFTVKKRENVEKVFWELLFLGTVFYIIGELILDLLFLKNGSFPSSPNLSDILYSMQPVFFLAAFIFLVSHDMRKTRMAITIVDILIIVMVISSLFWYLLFGPFLTKINLSTSEITILLSFPLLELLILFGIFHALFFIKQDSVSKQSLYIFAVSTMILFIAYVLELIFLMKKLDTFIPYLDPLFTLAMFSLSIAALHGNADHLTKSFFTRKKDFTQSHFLPLVSIVLLTFIYGIYDTEVDALFIGLIFSFFLLIIRLIIMLKENKQLNILLTKATIELEEKNRQLQETVAELKKINKIRSIEARTDFLSKLYNRRYIDHLLHSLIKEANTENKAFSILLIDIDHFKAVNDKYGHNVGDVVIEKAAQIFRESARNTDLIGRFGGEEFIIILPNSGLQVGIQLAKKILHKIASCSIALQEHCINITVSIGVTVWEMNDQFNDIYRRVDEALYEAKKSRNIIFVKTKSLTAIYK